MKNIFNKKQFSDIFILVLIILFSCLIIYQLYLAIDYKPRKNYSKLVEGFNISNITSQGPSDCTNLPNNYYDVIMTDISNIEILNNNVNNISNQVGGMITKNNNVNNTNIPDISLNTIISPITITSSSDYSEYYASISNNNKNINTLNGNIETIYNAIQSLPNGESQIQQNPPTFQSLTPNSITTTYSNSTPATSQQLSTVCQPQNTNINNINVLNANMISLNNLVNNLQNTQNSQLAGQSNSAMTISNAVGINN